MLYFQNNPILLEDDTVTLEQANIMEDQNVLIEVRNKDLSWPEEMSLLAKIKQDKQKQSKHIQYILCVHLSALNIEQTHS